MGPSPGLEAELADKADGVEALLAVSRGERVESLHFGCIAVCDATGRLRASCGDPGFVSFLRSTAKPLQALPFVEDGAAEAFGAQAQDLALACASHSGTDRHVEAVAEFQARVGLREADLRCGTHRPLDRQAAEVLRNRGEAPTPNRHNCSGKHTAMLALAKHLGGPLDSYLQPDHPVQKRILRVVAEMTGIPTAEIALGVDGCSAPNFALPLRGTATAYARLADPANMPLERGRAIERIRSAMKDFPSLVAGPGWFDTQLMEALEGRAVAKSGAEGYLGLAIEREGDVALGVALKVVDGDPKSRAKPLIALEVLRQMGLLDESSASALEGEIGSVVTSHRGEVVGKLAPCFELDWAHD